MLRWFPSPSCHYMLLMYPSRCKFSSTASSSCICVKNDCHRMKTQLQLNKYYYYYYYYFQVPSYFRSSMPLRVSQFSAQSTRPASQSITLSSHNDELPINISAPIRTSSYVLLVAAGKHDCLRLMK